MKLRQTCVAAALSIAVGLSSGCSGFARLYVVETPHPNVIDEAFYLMQSTVIAERAGNCLRFPLDLGISLSGNADPPKAFQYAVLPINSRGVPEDNKDLQFALVGRDRTLAAVCDELAKPNVGGTFSLSSQDGLKYERDPSLVFTKQLFGRWKVPTSTLDAQNGFARLSEYDLVVRESQGRLSLGEQLRLVLRLEAKNPGLTEIDLQTVQKPRGWVALAVGVVLIGAGTAAALVAAEP